MTSPMRPQDELQRAHDMLHAIVLGEVPFTMPAEDTRRMTAALDVLCWALRHDHNPSFGLNLAGIEEALEERGFILEKQDDHGT